jgi:hypothetical protein
MKFLSSKAVGVLLMVVLIVGIYAVSNVYKEYRTASKQRVAKEMEHWNSVESIGSLKDDGYEHRYLKSYPHEGELYKVYTLSKKTAGNGPRFLFAIAKEDGRFEEVIVKYPLRERADEAWVVHNENYVQAALQYVQLVGNRYGVVLINQEGKVIDELKNIYGENMSYTQDQTTFTYQAADSSETRIIYNIDGSLVEEASEKEQSQ